MNTSLIITVPIMSNITAFHQNVDRKIKLLIAVNFICYWLGKFIVRPKIKFQPTHHKQNLIYFLPQSITLCKKWHSKKCDPLCGQLIGPNLASMHPLNIEFLQNYAKWIDPYESVKSDFSQLKIITCFSIHICSSPFPCPPDFFYHHGWHLVLLFCIINIRSTTA